MKKVSRWSPGLTIIELVTTIVILGIVMIGLGLSLRTVTYHYQDDSVLLEVHNYGNTVMREIMKEISLARIINKEQINGYSRISLKKYDTFGKMIWHCFFCCLSQNVHCKFLALLTQRPKLSKL